MAKIQSNKRVVDARFWLKNLGEALDNKQGQVNIPSPAEQRKIVLFTVTKPLPGEEIALAVSDRLNALTVIDRTGIESYSRDKEVRDRIWGQLAKEAKTQYSQKLAEYAQLYERGITDDDSLRRFVRGAWILADSFANGNDYIVGWGAGLNFLFQQAIRIRLEVPHDQLSVLTGVPVHQIDHDNALADAWSRKSFGRRYNDPAYYDRIHTINAKAFHSLDQLVNECVEIILWDTQRINLLQK